MTDRLIAERQGPVGWITFNNPERHNAMNLEMWQALPQALSTFAEDGEVKVIVLRGAGDRSFISGADISEFEKHRSSAEAVAAYENLATATMRALQVVPKPTIAMIRGYCEAFGIGIDDQSLWAEAIEWQATRGARSGRVAWQYVTDLAGRRGVAL